MQMRHVQCTCKAGVVVLHGQLPTYYLKQIAQELVQRLDGVADVVNSIDVVDPDTRRHVDGPDESGNPTDDRDDR